MSDVSISGPAGKGESGMEGMAVLNRDAALERLGDEELLEQMLELFGGELDVMMEATRNSVSSGVAANVRLAAHSLKGAAQVIGAEQLAAAAYALEVAGQTAAAESYAARLEDLEAALATLRPALKQPVIH